MDTGSIGLGRGPFYNAIITFLTGWRLLGTLVGFATLAVMLLYPPAGDVLAGVEGMALVFLVTPFVASVSFMIAVFTGVTDDHRTAIGALLLAFTAVGVGLTPFGPGAVAVSVISLMYVVIAYLPWT